LFLLARQVGADEVVDLLAPNLNKEKMLYKAQMERDAQKSTAQMKKERDKAALDKQR
jgi:ferritin-like metal-binding protein YciE